MNAYVQQLLDMPTREMDRIILGFEDYYGQAPDANMFPRMRQHWEQLFEVFFQGYNLGILNVNK